MQPIERLAVSMDDYAKATLNGQLNRIAVHEVNGQVLNPPLLVLLNAADIDANMRLIAEDAHVVFPNVGEDEGALRLMEVHLEELVRTRAIPGATITLSSSGFEAAPMPPAAGSPQDAGQYQWVSERPPVSDGGPDTGG